MRSTVKIIQIGNSLGVTLPKDVLSALKVDKGDSVTLTMAPDGIRISSYDAGKSAQLAAARRIMKKRRHALRELAK